MNYLAHAFLAGDNQDFLMGNMCADILDGKSIKALPHTIMQGVIHHRAIDTFTDTHPQFKICKLLIHKSRRRYAGILIDLIFDHILTLKWQTYSNHSLKNFTTQTYKNVLDHPHPMPAKFNRIFAQMVEYDWLYNYNNDWGMQKTFSRIQKRLKRENNVSKAMDDFYEYQEKWEKAFNIFFPDLITQMHTDNL